MKPLGERQQLATFLVASKLGDLLPLDPSNRGKDEGRVRPESTATDRRRQVPDLFASGGHSARP